MGKAIIIQRKDGSGLDNFNERQALAHAIKRDYDETGVIIIPAFYDFVGFVDDEKSED